MGKNQIFWRLTDEECERIDKLKKMFSTKTRTETMRRLLDVFEFDEDDWDNIIHMVFDKGEYNKDVQKLLDKIVKIKMVLNKN